jgi:hypothetical protein
MLSPLAPTVLLLYHTSQYFDAIGRAVCVKVPRSIGLSADAGPALLEHGTWTLLLFVSGGSEEGSDLLIDLVGDVGNLLDGIFERPQIE